MSGGAARWVLPPAPLPLCGVLGYCFAHLSRVSYVSVAPSLLQASSSVSSSSPGPRQRQHIGVRGRWGGVACNTEAEEHGQLGVADATA